MGHSASPQPSLTIFTVHLKEMLLLSISHHFHSAITFLCFSCVVQMLLQGRWEINPASFNTDHYLTLTNSISETTTFRPMASIETYDDPSDVLAQWYQIFQSIVDRHVPLRTKKVKSLQLPK